MATFKYKVAWQSSNVAGKAVVENTTDLLSTHHHVLLIDLSSPTKQTPKGLHGFIWESLTGQTYEPLPHLPPVAASFEVTRDNFRAYVEPISFGEPLPEMPLYLAESFYIYVRLEKTYSSAFEGVPAHLQRALAANG